MLRSLGEEGQEVGEAVESEEAVVGDFVGDVLVLPGNVKGYVRGPASEVKHGQGVGLEAIADH